MLIRRIQSQDDQAIAQLIRSPFDEYRMETKHTVYDDDATDHQYEVFSKCARSVLWVADDGGYVVGSCGIYPTYGLPKDWCEVVKFYVDKRMRGKGIGMQLFQRALQSAVTLGYHTAYLETFPEFASAVGMYKRFGFKDVYHQMGRSGHTATSIWMTKQLRTQEFNDDDLKWQVIASKNIIHRPHLDAYKEKVELPNGTVYDEFYHLHFSPVVCIVAETTDGKLLIERQYRHAVRSVITEIPAGIVEPGEEPLAAAKRELQEETGYAGGQWTQLSEEYAQGGLQDNIMYGFYAKDVAPTHHRHLDKTEDITVYCIDKREVLGMLMNGEIMQAPLATPLWKYFVLYTNLLK